MVMNKQWLVASYPQGPLRPENFAWQEAELEPVAAGMVRTRTLYISMDPTNRVWFSQASYLPPLEIGQVMPGACIGVVEESANPAFQPGDLVQSLGGWQTHTTSDGADLTVLPDLPGLPLTAHFGLLGHIGLSAHYGMLSIAKPQPGETVVVSAASGAVGSLAGQIAKLKGARVVGIAGTARKCRRITEELGFDHAIDYRNENVIARLREYCPDGVDVYFDNVGGTVLDAALGEINNFGRVVACGMISEYNDTGEGENFVNLSNLVNRRVSLQGFVVLDHLDIIEQAYPELIQWHLDGKLDYAVDVVPGLESAPSALSRLFDGTNAGKLIVQVSDEGGR